MAADELAPLREAAASNKVTIVCGIDERDGDFSRATLYHTVVTIGTQSEILNRHRKLMPTNPERMVWGFGDASGLKVVETSAGRVGTLVCWVNFMPLARFALYAQGIEIYIALRPMTAATTGSVHSGILRAKAAAGSRDAATH